jgi:transcriptional regulator with XRE-family HTH domain
LCAADSQPWRRMQKSLKSPEYARLVATLVAVRNVADISQQQLADRLDEHQSFVAKYEGGERRIDVVEFIAIARALNADPVKLFRDFAAGKPPPPAKVKKKK